MWLLIAGWTGMTRHLSLYLGDLLLLVRIEDLYDLER